MWRVDSVHYGTLMWRQCRLAGDLFAPVNSDYITIPWILNNFCVIWKTRGGPIDLFKFIHYELLNVNSRASVPTLKKHWWVRVLPLSLSLDVSYKFENPWDFQKTWPLTLITRLRSLRCTMVSIWNTYDSWVIVFKTWPLRLKFTVDF